MMSDFEYDCWQRKRIAQQASTASAEARARNAQCQQTT